MTTGPADSPDAAICARVESDRRVGTKGAGWLHRLRNDDLFRPERRTRRLSMETPAEPPINFDAMAAECESALGPLRRGALAAELGVASAALSRLQVGWSQRHRSYTFPMRDGEGSVRGIRLRRPDGSKWAVKGSRQGLFLPWHFPCGDFFVVCEGPTDTAAMLSLGFDAVGRPSCSGGERLLMGLVTSSFVPQGVAIMADDDGPGYRGAWNLAAALTAYVPTVRVVTPPAKDAREWLRQGATRLDAMLKRRTEGQA